MVWRWVGAYVAVAVVGSIVGCGKEPTASGPKGTYDQHCAKCHARSGEPGGPSTGYGSRGPDLSKIGASHDAEWIADFIRDPKSKRADAKVMPAFSATLTEAQIKELAEWLAAKK